MIGCHLVQKTFNYHASNIVRFTTFSSSVSPRGQQQLLHKLRRMSSSSSSSSIQRIGVDDPRMSRIVIHNSTVYISGQTDATGSNIQDQTKNVLAKVDALLMEAGTDKSKLLTSSIWLKDIGRDFKGMNSVWNDWLDPGCKPVRATVEANMARPVLLIEVQVTAAVSTS